jgi:starch phosphorylase
MLMASHLVGGMDVWLNTPQRPWEASGTSGMKVLVNGGVNLSELDGWWVEAYTPEVGWALGDGLEHYNDPDLDRREAEALFGLLEQQVIPEFYQRNEHNIPESWTKRIRNSMATLTPYFSSNRTVREYTEKYYLPAAATYLDRAANNSALGKKIVQWKHETDQHWPHLAFGESTVRNTSDHHIVDIQVFLGGIDAQSIAVQLFAGALPNGEVFKAEMKAVGPVEGKEAGWTWYHGEAPATRPAGDFTARIIPRNGDISVPLEYGRILWQH